MMDAFAWVEQTGISRFVREDFYAYFVLLIAHAWGMAFLVGGGTAISLRILGVGKQARLERFAVFIPVMKIGAALAIVSGIFLLAGYPAKALTNWVFAVKLSAFIAGGLIVRHVARHIMPQAAQDRALPGRARWLATAALALFYGGVVCGKLLLYTNKMLLVS